METFLCKDGRVKTYNKGNYIDFRNENDVSFTQITGNKEDKLLLISENNDLYQYTGSNNFEKVFCDDIKVKYAYIDRDIIFLIDIQGNLFVNDWGREHLDLDDSGFEVIKNDNFKEFNQIITHNKFNIDFKSCEKVIYTPAKIYGILSILNKNNDLLIFLLIDQDYASENSCLLINNIKSIEIIGNKILYLSNTGIWMIKECGNYVKVINFIVEPDIISFKTMYTILVYINSQGKAFVNYYNDDDYGNAKLQCIDSHQLHKSNNFESIEISGESESLCIARIFLFTSSGTIKCSEYVCYYDFYLGESDKYINDIL